jgi:hypothetical protein
MSDWVPVSGRTKLYVWIASALWSVGLVAGFLSRKPDDAFYVIGHALLFVLLIGSWGITLWSGLRCRNPRLRIGWLLVAAGQILSLSTSFVMVAASYLSAIPKFDSAAPLLTVAFLTVGVGLTVAATSIDGVGGRWAPFLQAAGLSVFMFAVMLAALLGPGPTMPFAIGPRDVTAIMRLALDCGFIFGVGVYATLLQLRQEDGHRARSWMWAAASALVAAMGDVTAPLVDLGHGQIYPELLWCLGDVLLAVAACLAADFELAERSAKQGKRSVEEGVEGVAAESAGFGKLAKRTV